MSTSLVLTGLDDSSRRSVSLSDAAPPVPDDADLLAVEDESDRLVKRYRDPTARRREKIAAMLDAPPEPPSLDDAPGLDDGAEPSFVQLAWPTAHAETENGDWVGYAMPAVDRDRCTTLQHLLSAEERADQGLSNAYRLRIGAAYHLAELVEALHAEDHYVVDLIPSRVHLDREAFFVALTGCDDFSVAPRTYSGDRFAGPAPTPGYTVPEVARGEEALPEYGEEQDCFALAVVVFQLLNRGLHPYEGPYREGKEGPSATQERINENLYAYGRDEHPTVQPASESLHPWFDNGTMRLLERALEGGGIGSRPSASRWRRHLQAYVARKPERLQVCDQNEEHATYPGQECGFCALEEQRAGYGQKLTETQEDKWSEIDEEEDEWTETSEEEDDWTDTSDEEQEWIETSDEEEQWTDTAIDDETAETDGSGEQDAADDNWADTLDEDAQHVARDPYEPPSRDEDVEQPGRDSYDSPSSGGEDSQEASAPDDSSPADPQASDASPSSKAATTSTDDAPHVDDSRKKTEKTRADDSTTSHVSGGTCAAFVLMGSLGALLLFYGVSDSGESDQSPASEEQHQTAGPNEPLGSTSDQEAASNTGQSDPGETSAAASDTTSGRADASSPDTLTVGGQYLRVHLDPRSGTPQLEITSPPEFDQYDDVTVQRLRDGDTTAVSHDGPPTPVVALDSFRRGDRIRVLGHAETYANGWTDRVLVMDTTYTASIAALVEQARTATRTDPTIASTSTVTVPSDARPSLTVVFRHTDDVRTLIRTSFADTTSTVSMALFYRERDGKIESLGMDRGPAPEVECFDLKAGDKVALMIYSDQRSVMRVGLRYRGPDEPAQVIGQPSNLRSSARR